MDHKLWQLSTALGSSGWQSGCIGISINVDNCISLGVHKRPFINKLHFSCNINAVSIFQSLKRILDKHILYNNLCAYSVKLNSKFSAYCFTIFCIEASFLCQSVRQAQPLIGISHAIKYYHKGGFYIG